MFLTSLLLVSLLGCADPAKDKTVATVSEPAKPALDAPKPAAPAAELQKLPASGSVGFVGAKITRTHDGSFGKWSGSLDMGGLDLVGLHLEVQMDSVESDTAKLTEHLKSPDFFDVGTFPTSSFQSTAIKAGAPADSKLAGATHTVEGDLTMRGVTKRLSFPAVITVSPDAVAAKTEFAINRKDFGIQYPGKPDDLIKDEVLLKVDLIANRANVLPSAPAATTAPAPTGTTPAAPAGAPTTTTP